MIARRQFLLGLAAGITAPAIVRPTSIMRIAPKLIEARYGDIFRMGPDELVCVVYQDLLRDLVDSGRVIAEIAGTYGAAHYLTTCTGERTGIRVIESLMLPNA